MINETVDGYVGSYRFELTSSNTQTYFQNAINVLLNIASESPNQTSAADLTNYNNALNTLKDLAKGFIPGTTTPLDSPITAQMAKSINALLSLTQSVNSNYGDTQIASINNSIGLNSVNQLTSWKDLYTSGAQSILTNAAIHSDATAVTTLQSYLQTNYIQTGNEILYNQLSSLKQALSATQQALILLGNVQSLKNRANVQAPSYTNAEKWSAGILPTKKIVTVNGVQVLTQFGVGSIASYYEKSNSPTIGSRLLINVDPNFAASIQDQGMQLVSQLRASITDLNKVNPAGANDPNSLQTQLQNIVNDMTAGAPSPSNVPASNNLQSDLVNQISSIISTFQTSSVPAIQNSAYIGQLQNVLNGLPQSVLGANQTSFNTLLQNVAAVPFLIFSSPQIVNSISAAADDVTAMNHQATSIQWWVLDNYNDNSVTSNGTTFQKSDFNTAKAGNYQRNLTNGITTAENLNDSQKASLQTAIFNFQEFYQSASAILSMINQFMQKMAGQISR